VVGDSIDQYGTLRYYQPVTVMMKNVLRTVYQWERT
jgi:hypothetical protein